MQQNLILFLSKPFQVLTVEGIYYMTAGVKHEYFGYLPKNDMSGYWKVSSMSHKKANAFSPQANCFALKGRRSIRMEVSF